MNPSPHRVEPPPDDAVPPEPPLAAGAAVLNHIRLLVSEMWEFARYYLSVRADHARAWVQRLAFIVVAGLAAALILGGLFVAAGWFVMSGLAGGFTAWLGPVWLGQLLAGLLVIGGGLGGLWFGWRRREAYRLAQTRAKYEQRQAKQQTEFGHSVGHPNGTGPDRD